MIKLMLRRIMINNLFRIAAMHKMQCWPFRSAEQGWKTTCRPPATLPWGNHDALRTGPPRLRSAAISIGPSENSPLSARLVKSRR